MSQDVCVLDWSINFFVLQPQNFWNVSTTFDFFFPPKQQLLNEKTLCLETKLWSKVIFSQHVQGYAKTSVWFVNVAYCYCSDRRNWNKFFLTTEFPFVQSYHILMGWLWTTLVVFIWQRRINEPIIFVFRKERL